MEEVGRMTRRTGGDPGEVGSESRGMEEGMVGSPQGH